jgi:ketosteroid isomerase-like protein
MKRLFLGFSNPFIALHCKGQAAPAGQTKEERAIRAADAKGLKAAQAKDVEGATFNYADNASWLPPNAPIAEGKDAIRAGWSQLLAAPGFSIDWQITKIEISRSHDLAYTLYTYQLNMQGADGKPIADRGKDLAVWKKQSNGTWKIVTDTFNSDLPAPTPAKSQ